MISILIIFKQFPLKSCLKLHLKDPFKSFTRKNDNQENSFVNFESFYLKAL